MYFYGIDATYIFLVLPAVIFALWAQFNVKSTFSKYSKIASRSGMTGFDSARRILDANGLGDVRIAHVSGDLTDHYNPTDNTIYLSDSVYGSDSAAAIGVAAHEAGHAVQHATGYTPIKIRSAIIPITNIGSNLAMPLIILGIVLSFPTLAYIGVAAFGLSTLFQLVTLPVEFDASGRALKALEGSLDGDDLASARKVLRAAALTYVAALAVSLVNLLRLLIIAAGSDRRRRR
ncbi:MAG: zinc metallopeptidase [Candidatus Flemingibacterium sp.]|nr:zinc metallopeptidase [Candidatus Flemingibacterium sp.]